mmetsp:Transcript_62307/g.178791  ORF Transcript_62307/g.178791 Transcript_62307/m.178791 type:complete len:85 (+) Transcript_62307:195-449(+)
MRDRRGRSVKRLRSPPGGRAAECIDCHIGPRDRFFVSASQGAQGGCAAFLDASSRRVRRDGWAQRAAAAMREETLRRSLLEYFR